MLYPAPPSQPFATVEKVDNGFIVRYQEITRRPIEKNPAKAQGIKKGIEAVAASPLFESLGKEKAEALMKALMPTFDSTPTERATFEQRSVFCGTMENVSAAIEAAAQKHEEILEARKNGEYAFGYPDYGVGTVVGG